MTLTIEPAGTGRLADCERLWNASLSIMFPGRSSGAADSFATLVEGEDVYVAREHGSVAGFVSLWRPDAFIHFLVVDASCRRRGTGSALLSFALDELATTAHLKCGLANTSAHAFYAARGARIVKTVEDGDEPYILYAFDPLPAAALPG